MTTPHYDVNRLNLTAVAAALIGDGMAADEAARAVDLYRQFLATAAAYPTATLVPTKLIDRAWHAHLALDYEGDCRALCGAVLVHRPGVYGTPEWLDAYAVTRKLAAYGAAMDVNPLGDGPMAGAECFRAAASPMAGAECFLARRAA